MPYTRGQLGKKMHFTDEGYIITTRKYGENSLIISLVTKEHGMVSGFVKNALSKKSLGIYQLGNKLSVDAYSRIEENMLTFKVDLLSPVAVNFLNSPQKLSVLTSICSLLNVTLAEKENLERFYYYIDSFFMLINDTNWLTHYCFFEFYLLEHLGIGLDLSECAATGVCENLTFVSPKSGRAVCEDAGFVYREKMFVYPHFIIEKNYTPTPTEVLDLLKMTEFFLRKNFFQTHGLKFPQNRDSLLHNLNMW